MANKLTKDGNGQIYTTLTLEQSELCDYVIIDGRRFVAETEYQRGAREGRVSPSTGHVYGCNCFVCNH